MTTYLYAVYDRLSNTFGSLVENHTDGSAIRDFKRLYEKGITADPSQFELHKIAKVVRSEDSVGSAILCVEPVGQSLVYNYTAFVSERLDGNSLIDQIALLEQEDIDKVSDFVKFLKEGGETNGSK